MSILRRISNLKQSMSQKNPRFEDQYDLKNRLGSGAFATVYACTKRDVECPTAAVKVFDRTRQSGLRREFRGEVELLRIVTPNEHCVQMLDSFESRKFCYIVMEKCGVSVQEAFYQCEACEINELDIAHVLKCMLTGIQHLHECGIVHRDIKPGNLLLAEGCTSNLSSRPTVKICDLGLSAKLPACGGLTEVCGTPPYMSPEMLTKGKTYHKGVDIWSCGVTAYLMLLGTYPYKGERYDTAEVKAAIRDGKTLPTFRARPGFVQPSEAAMKFVALLLRREPELRADAERALNSNYLSQLSSPSPSLSLPSFGPTLSLVHDLTRDEPAAETPVVRDLQDSKDDDSSDSTSCGGPSSNGTGEGFSRSSTCDSISRIGEGKRTIVSL